MMTPTPPAASRIRKYCTVNINFVPTFRGWSPLGLILGRNSDCGGRSLAKLLNVRTYLRASLTISFACSLCPSRLNAFLLFHIFQAVVAKRFQSVTPLSSLSFQITSMKSFREWAR
ncbi:hypothetical protein ACB098_07G166700 [Castanea mollissima]